MQLSIMEYIKKYELGITRQGVLWRINNGLALDYVTNIERIGRQYVLTVTVHP